jgi:hypothetical protein
MTTHTPADIAYAEAYAAESHVSNEVLENLRRAFYRTPPNSPKRAAVEVAIHGRRIARERALQAWHEARAAERNVASYQAQQATEKVAAPPMLRPEGTETTEAPRSPSALVRRVQTFPAMSNANLSLTCDTYYRVTYQDVGCMGEWHFTAKRPAGRRNGFWCKAIHDEAGAKRAAWDYACERARYLATSAGLDPLYTRVVVELHEPGGKREVFRAHLGSPNWQKLLDAAPCFHLAL